jgi:hypothetical protein
MRSLLSAVLLTFALGTALPAQVRTFQLTGTFASGATFSGFFTMNGATRSILASNITTQAEPGWLERTYTTTGTGEPFFAGETYVVPNEFAVQLFQPGGGLSLLLWFAGPAASFTGGAIQAYPASCPTVPVRLCASSREAVLTSARPVRRLITGGNATLVPEPSAALLLVPALGGLFLRRVRRRDSRVA